MKKIFTFLFATFILFSFAACNHSNTLHLTSNSQKESPSTVLTVEMTTQSKKGEEITLTVGMGKRNHSQYNNYLETVLCIEGNGIVIFDSKDTYSQTINITEEKYLCTEDNAPVFFTDIPINFENVLQDSGSFTVSLTSYFENDETNGTCFTVHYTVKGDTVRFSAS